MKPDEILALQNEPACNHNHKSKSGCTRPQPGATQGGCCFDGARNALVPITDAAHIVHGPIGCAGSSWDARGSRSSGPMLYRIGMTTDLAELDVILGSGTARLIEGVGHVVERYKPAAVFLYNTCVTAMSGDDLAVIARTAAERWNVPVVPVDCGGFYGNKNFGNRIAGDVLLRHVIGTAEPEPVSPAAIAPGHRSYAVNLIGEWNVGGEFWNVAPLFDELGLRVLCTLTGDARFRDLQAMHRADANMVVCSKAMLSVARGMKERWGTPFFEGSFYGIADTSQALRDFARLLGDPDLTGRTGALIAREEAKVEAALAPYRRRLAGKRVLIFSGGFKSMVGDRGDAGAGPDRRRVRDREIDRGRQGTDPRVDGCRCADDRRQRPDDAAADFRRMRRRYSRRRRSLHLPCAQGTGAVSRPRPRPRHWLRRLRGHAAVRPSGGRLGREPGVGAGPCPTALGRSQ